MAKPNAEPAAKGGGMMSSILGLLMITGLAVGGGGLFGLQIAQRFGPNAAKSTPAHTPAPDNHGAKDHGHGKEATPKGHGPRLVNLPNIITNLASPEKTWIRIEAAVVIEGENADKLPGIVAEDIIAYLRTVKLEDLQGGSGYLYLREDLNERIRVRGQGKVRDLVLQSLIVE